MISKEKASYIRSLGTRDGHIEPTAVVEAARDPKSPIHHEFEWDVSAAAQEHWLDTARTLIRFVRLEVTIESERIVAPYYVVDPDRPSRSKRYVALTRAARDREIAERVLLDELDRVAAALKRAHDVAAVLGLTAKLEELLDDVLALKSKAERRAAAKDRATRKPPRRRPPRPEARA
jgi:hypothetical protein